MMEEILPYPLYFLIIPIGLRLTCYYFHGWYEEKIFRRFFPNLISSNLGFNIDFFHRIFLILSIPLILIHFLISLYHTVIDKSYWVKLNSLESLTSAIKSVFIYKWGLNFGTFNLTEWVDTIFLSLYVFSCHVIRYFFGSCAKCYYKSSKLKLKLLNCQTGLNNLHGIFFWLSIASLIAHSTAVTALKV